MTGRRAEVLVYAHRARRDERRRAVAGRHAVGVLERVADGTTSTNSLEELPALAQTLEQTSICGLGQVALVPILSMLEHFPDEVPRP